MNRIKVDNIILNNDNIYLENQIISKIISNGQNELNLYNCIFEDLEIEINNISTLNINCYNNIDKSNCIIKIEAKEKSNISFNHSFQVKDDYKLNILTDFLANNAKIELNIHGLNNGGNVLVNVDGYVKNNHNDNVLDENMRIINLNNGKSISNPNMYIDTSKVIANHNTTIGGIDKNELFYLMSKGIEKNEAIKIISEGFIISNITNSDLKEIIKNNL